MKDKWVTVSIFLLAVVGFALAWLFLQNTTTVKSDTADVMSDVVAQKRDANTLVIGLDPHYPPLEFFNSENEFTGFDIDLLDAAMKKMGKPYELKVIEWGDKTELLNNKTIDVIWSGLNITDERSKLYELSNSYLNSEQVITVLASSNITRQEQLAGKRIGIETGSFVGPMIDEWGEKNPAGPVGVVNEYSESAVATVKLLTDEVDAVISDAVNAKYYASRSDGKFRVLPQPFWKGEGVAVAARKGETQIISEINSTLDELRKNGTYQSIYDKWFGS